MRKLYETLNPVDLRRKIEAKLTKLHKVSHKNAEKIDSRAKKLTPTLVSYYIGQPV